MSIRVTATVLLLLHMGPLSLTSAAQSSTIPPRDERFVPAATSVSSGAPPVRSLLLRSSAQVARGAEPVVYGLVGALVGGLAMAGYLAHGCSQTDCILDPTVPIAIGIGVGFVVGFIIGGGVRLQ